LCVFCAGTESLSLTLSLLVVVFNEKSGYVNSQSEFGGVALGATRRMKCKSAQEK